jgi:ABC-2 type transport system ATP-binding protein
MGALYARIRQLKITGNNMNALTIENLKKTYDNGVEALKGISFSVKKGDFFALLGPNGAGKSTTIGIIASLVTKTAGKVQILDHDIDVDFPRAKTCLGLVPQEINCSIFETVSNVLLYQAGYYGIPRSTAKSRLEFYLKKLDLWDKRDERVQNLSGGMKRRLMIARALVHEPKLLILDEPTAGVDIEIRRSMWQFFQEMNARGTTIILTTHYLEEAESLCNNIAIINQGQIVENTDMKSLLQTLNIETFVLDLEKPIMSPPTLTDYECRLRDATTLEVDIYKEQSINEAFVQLDAQQITVTSMRNKANRLEELFLNLVGNGQEGERP